MKHFCDEWVQEWCEENGWTDLFMERKDHYWAFPPGCVMPEPIPAQTMYRIKAQKGLSREEKLWLSSTGAISVLSAVLSLVLKCPMPIVFAFGVGAITVAQLEVELI